MSEPFHIIYSHFSDWWDNIWIRAALKSVLYIYITSKCCNIPFLIQGKGWHMPICHSFIIIHICLSIIVHENSGLDQCCRVHSAHSNLIRSVVLGMALRLESIDWNITVKRSVRKRNVSTVKVSLVGLRAPEIHLSIQAGCSPLPLTR